MTEFGKLGKLRRFGIKIRQICQLSLSIKKTHVEVLGANPPNPG